VNQRKEAASVQDRDGSSILISSIGDIYAARYRQELSERKGIVPTKYKLSSDSDKIRKLGIERLHPLEDIFSDIERSESSFASINEIALREKELHDEVEIARVGTTMAGIFAGI
jgi:hypothetical protein